MKRPDWISGIEPFFTRSLLGVELWQWIALLVLVLAGSVAGYAARAIAGWLIVLRQRVIKAPLSAEIRAAFRRASFLQGFVWLYSITVGQLLLNPHAENVVEKALDSLQIVALVMFAYAAWDALSERVALSAAGRSDRADRLLVPVIRKLVHTLIIIIGLLIAIATLTNVNLSAFIASLGIGGLVVALAAKDSVENLFGSVTILFDTPFAIGDWVKIDKIEGIVEQINLRSTRIRTFEDTVINLPNANLIRAAVENFGARRVRRQQLSVKLAYNNTPEKIDLFCEKVRDLVRAMPEVQGARAIVDVEALGDSSISVMIQCHFEVVSQSDEMRLRHQLLLQILKIRAEVGIEFRQL